MENPLDLSSVVSLIMKHPELIEEIAALAKSEVETKSEPTVVETEGTGSKQGEEWEAPRVVEPVSEASTQPIVSRRENRKKLFSAIRPFLSEERARTLSSVEAVVSILDSLHS